MHTANRSRWQHSHDFSSDSSVAEKRTRIVIAITAVMMIIEIIGGSVFNSMALLADGWHMSTHVAAFLITALAYSLSRRYRNNPQYSFGTGKIGVLGGFASAVVLFGVAFLMALESIERFFSPVSIQFNEAIGIAILGLIVNLVCAFLFQGGHEHHHHHHGHDHHHHHHQSHDHDLNLRAAYLHVLADAFTSVTAIVALSFGKFFAWNWLDPVMGLVGSAVVSVWAYGLIRQTSAILLDRTPASTDLPEEIRSSIESDGDSVVTDLHVWQVGEGKFAAIASIVAHEPKSVDTYKEPLREHEELVHVTIEVHRCTDHEETIPTSAKA